VDYYLNVNGVNTALTCSLTSSTTGFSTCVGTNPVAVAADDLITVSYVAAQSFTANLMFGLVCEVP
jgi:hypothetical protein